MKKKKERKALFENILGFLWELYTQQHHIRYPLHGGVTAPTISSFCQMSTMRGWEGVEGKVILHWEPLRYFDICNMNFTFWTVYPNTESWAVIVLCHTNNMVFFYLIWFLLLWPLPHFYTKASKSYSLSICFRVGWVGLLSPGKQNLQKYS